MLGNILAKKECCGMSQKPPTIEVVWGGQDSRTELARPAVLGGSIRLDSEAWFAWLEMPSVVSFAYPILDASAGWIAGYMTVRKEPRRRGSQYWVAYRRHAGRLRKVYLGRSSQVTSARLVAVGHAMGSNMAIGSERRRWNRCD
jgi:hypothetical protein